MFLLHARDCAQLLVGQDDSTATVGLEDEYEVNDLSAATPHQPETVDR